MTAALAYPAEPAVMPLQAATQRLWMIRHLLRERAIDPLAADLSVRLFRDHPNERVRALAGATDSDIADRLLTGRLAR